MAFPFNKTPLVADLNELTTPVTLHKVDETKFESLWDEMVREYHYLGYESVIGGRSKYIIALGKRILGGISFCSASFKLGPRDKFVGWDEQTRLEYLPRLINNNRFLILPWVRVRNLASHVLSMSLKRVRLDWERWYGVEPYMAETFVDCDKYPGTCYIAANWVYLGTTKGFGRQGNTFVYHGNRKAIYVKIMSRRFFHAFRPSVDRLSTDSKEIMSILNSISIPYGSFISDLGLNSDTPEVTDALLTSHVLRYLPFLTRKELNTHLVANLKGRFSDLERKSVEPICLAFTTPDHVRPMQNFFTRSEWDHEGMLDEYQKEVAEHLSGQNGMITCEGYDFPKHGSMSVGVSRQPCGPLGKNNNCQASVMAGYASEKGNALLDFELFMPAKWFDDNYADKREKCIVPDDLKFKTKTQIFLDMVNKLVDSGLFKAKYVGIDFAFGRDHDFLDALPKSLTYFADISLNHRVFVGRPEMLVPKHKGRAPKQRGLVPSFPAKAVSEIANDESIPWNYEPFGKGDKDTTISRDKLLMVVEERDGEPGQDVWLYIWELEDNTVRCSLCNAPMGTPLGEFRNIALMRKSIEQSINECKKYLGLGHYEVRSWHGWRRHILLTFIASLFAQKFRHNLPMENNKLEPGQIVKPQATFYDTVGAAANFQHGEKE
jgi:SRSO17 transposase